MQITFTGKVIDIADIICLMMRMIMKKNTIPMTITMFSTDLPIYYESLSEYTPPFKLELRQ